MATALPTAPADEIARFLARYRRRAILRSLLIQVFVAFVLNEAVRWSSVLLGHWQGADITIVNVGPIYLLVVAALLARRWTTTRAAAAADQSLAFKDRLVSHLDFSTNQRIPENYREAQASEVVSALLPHRLPGGPPLPRLLFVGPCLLLASILYPLFLPSGSTNLLVFRTATDSRRAPRSGAVETVRRRTEDRTAGTNDKTAERKPKSAEDGPGSPSRDPEPGDKAASTPLQSPAVGRHVKDITPDGPLVSTRIGSELTKVVQPLLRDNELPARAISPPVGSLAFRLVPSSAKIGAGEGGEGGENPEQVVVDFNAVPEEYRSLVHRYYTLLGKGSGRETGRHVRSTADAPGGTDPGTPHSKEGS